MKVFLLLMLFATSGPVIAQQETFDLLTYTPPPGTKWKKTADKNHVVYTTTDNKTKKWCQIAIYKSTASQGNIQSDFDKEWRDLVAASLNVQQGPVKEDVQTAEGWDIQTASGKFLFNKDQCAVILTSFSGHNVCLSILLQTNAARYLEDFQNLIGTIHLSLPGTAGKQTSDSKQPSTDGFTFYKTNWDDGWTSTVSEDWVEVTKGNVKVLLHYPKEGTIVAADPEPHVNNAWNMLVAPRYSNLKNYKVVSPSLDYDRAYLGSGNLTDPQGNELFVALFRKGRTGWVEFIAPDKNTFVQTFGVNPDLISWDAESSIWNPLLKLAAYNKFAVAASDLKGIWTGDFGSMQQLYNIYTGQYAGMTTYQSNETFEFGAGGSYKWSLLVINGTLGNSQYTSVKSSGNVSVVNNWQIRCSDIEGKPKTFNAYFSCIKGARVLWLENAQYPSGYSAYGLKK